VDRPVHAGPKDTNDLDISIELTNKEDEAVLRYLPRASHGRFRPALRFYGVGEI